MNFLTFFLVLFSFIFNGNGRRITSNENSINQNTSSHSILSNKSLNLFSTQNFVRHQIKLGQISGLASSIGNPDELFIFHRGSRQWNQQSFPDGYHFDKDNFGVIPENTIVTVDIRTGEVTNQCGNNTFFMPHGLSTDHQGNIWLTDVAMHQVFKYSGEKLVLILGELFVPGDDSFHFCKPTDVVVSSNGSNIYVADGYCNSRIVKFDSNGRFVKQYEMPKGDKPLVVPHSLVLIESLDLICVADRENGRIVCFDTNDGGIVKYIIEHPSMNTVYGITYDSNKHRLYAISGKSLFGEARGFTFSGYSNSFGDLIESWIPTDKFGEPHDLTLSVDGRSLFVGEIRPNRIDSFHIKS